MRESVAVTNRLILVLSPWTSFVVIPIFALANAGIGLSTDSLGNLWSSPVSLGVILGLVVGKPLGVTAATWLALKFNLASLPEGLTMRHVLGSGAVAGIGFTVALFIARLAFVDAEGRPTALVDQAVIGILAASVLASLIGWLILRGIEPQRPIAADDEGDSVMAEPTVTS